MIPWSLTIWTTFRNPTIFTSSLWTSSASLLFTIHSPGIRGNKRSCFAKQWTDILATLIARLCDADDWILFWACPFATQLYSTEWQPATIKEKNHSNPHWKNSATAPRASVILCGLFCFNICVEFPRVEDSVSGEDLSNSYSAITVTWFPSKCGKVEPRRIKLSPRSSGQSGFNVKIRAITTSSQMELKINEVK